MNSTSEVAWETRPDLVGLSQLAALLLNPSGSATPESISNQAPDDEDSGDQAGGIGGGL
jgi:hypothetical protein